MLSNMSTKISNLVTRDIVVTKEFYDYANQQHAKGTYKSRKHCDYLLLEWFLRFGCDRPLVKHPRNYKHDWIWPPDLIDAKRMESLYYNITNSKEPNGPTAEQKLAWIKSRVSQGELTHFLFYNTIDAGQIFKVGQIVPHTFFAYEDANEVLLKMQTSQYDGYYYAPKKLLH